MLHFIKFVGVGGIATAIQYLILVILVEVTIIDAVMASAIGYAISAVFNYLLNYYFTFDSNAKHSVAILKFFIVVCFGLVLNTLFMYILVDFFIFHYLISQLVTTALVLVFNFVAHKFWTYKSKIGKNYAN